MRPDGKKASRIKVFMYEAELNYLKWLVLQKPAIETGGDLFGLWQDRHTAVVQLILGPGKRCSRTTTSFHQDLDYLAGVGKYLTASQGLCNIGEWHSHHRIGLTEPSGGDRTTVWNNIGQVAGGRFLLFIANINGYRSPEVNVGCFVFIEAKNKMVVGIIESRPSLSPLRDVSKGRLNEGAEKGQDWETFVKIQEESVRKSARQPPGNSRGTSTEEKRNVFGDETYSDENDENSCGDDTPMLERREDEKKEKMTIKEFLLRYLCCCCSPAEENNENSCGEDTPMLGRREDEEKENG